MNAASKGLYSHYSCVPSHYLSLCYHHNRNWFPFLYAPIVVENGILNGNYILVFIVIIHSLNNPS